MERPNQYLLEAVVLPPPAYMCDGRKNYVMTFFMVLLYLYHEFYYNQHINQQMQLIKNAFYD